MNLIFWFKFKEHFVKISRYSSNVLNFDRSFSLAAWTATTYHSLSIFFFLTLTKLELLISFRKNIFNETTFLHVIFQYPSSQISYGSWRTPTSMWTRHLTVPRWVRRVYPGMSPISLSSRDWSGPTTRDSATQKVTVLTWLWTLLSRITTRFR